MLGWRKLSAWFLVYLLVVATVIFSKEINDNAKDVLIWVTGLFFGTNAVKPAIGVVVDNVLKTKP